MAILGCSKANRCKGEGAESSCSLFLDHPKIGDKRRGNSCYDIKIPALESHHFGDGSVDEKPA